MYPLSNYFQINNKIEEIKYLNGDILFSLGDAAI